MDYNTNRKKLELPEYGRHVQEMVDIIKRTPDRETRNRLAMSTIQLMGNMNPQLRDVADFKHKLWDHLAVIADFDLDIDTPYPLPTEAEIHQKPSKMLYSNPDEIRFRHYGKILENMVRKITQYPEGEERDALIAIVGNQMKKSFLTWNRETVSDDVIFSDMLAIACHRLTIPQGLKLKDSKELLRMQALANNNNGVGSKNSAKKHKASKKKNAPKKQK